MYQSTFLSLLLQLAIFSFAMAEETLVATNHGNAWQYGAGGGVLGFIVLILDIIAFMELLKSSRPVTHKVLWCVVIFLFPIMGFIFYWLFSNRTAHMGSGGYESIA